MHKHSTPPPLPRHYFNFQCFTDTSPSHYFLAVPLISRWVLHCIIFNISHIFVFQKVQITMFNHIYFLFIHVSKNICKVCSIFEGPYYVYMHLVSFFEIVLFIQHCSAENSTSFLFSLLPTPTKLFTQRSEQAQSSHFSLDIKIKLKNTLMIGDT